MKARYELREYHKGKRSDQINENNEQTLMEEHLNSEVSPYLFNGKERDKETGFYYYGARYYDPKTSLWLGVDPLAVYDPVNETEYYFDGQHNGGAFNYGNLNPYVYCYQNPVRYIDPNGKQIIGNYFGIFLDGNKTDDELGELKLKLNEKIYKLENLIIAETLVVETLLESSGPGEYLQMIREKVINTYGTEEMKESSEVYSNAVGIIRNIKSVIAKKELEKNKSNNIFKDYINPVDVYISKMVTVLSSKAIREQIEVSSMKSRIEAIDNELHDRCIESKGIDRCDWFKDGGFGGGGEGIPGTW